VKARISCLSLNMKNGITSRTKMIKRKVEKLVGDLPPQP